MGKQITLVSVPPPPQWMGSRQKPTSQIQKKKSRKCGEKNTKIKTKTKTKKPTKIKYWRDHTRLKNAYERILYNYSQEKEKKKDLKWNFFSGKQCPLQIKELLRILRLGVHFDYNKESKNKEVNQRCLNQCYNNSSTNQ